VKDSKDILLGRETARVLSSRSLLHSLSIVERALQQNVFHAAHRMYKAVTGVEMLESLVASNAATPAKPRGALCCAGAFVCFHSILMLVLLCCRGG
jgi:hypothetical protein